MNTVAAGLLVGLPCLASHMAGDGHAHQLARGVLSEKDMVWAICELNGNRSSLLLNVGHVLFGIMTTLGEDRLVRESPFCWDHIHKQHMIVR